MASIVQCVPHRTRVAMRFASLRSRLDLPGIVKEARQCLRFPACREPSRTPPVERHGTPRNRPTRRQQQGRAPNQDKRRLGARQQRQPSRGRGTRGPRSIGLLMNNELCAGVGVRALLLACIRGLGLGRGSGVGMRVPPHRRGCVREWRWVAKSSLGWYALFGTVVLSSGNSG